MFFAHLQILENDDMIKVLPFYAQSVISFYFTHILKNYGHIHTDFCD